jgi:hypothetical protein
MVETITTEGPCHLYQVVHRETGHDYVGISVEYKERWTRHKWEAFNNDCDTHFARALRKYGVEAFEWKVLLEFKTVADAKEAEIFAIANGYGYYNETEGGDGVNGLSEKGRAKKSAALKGRPKSPETKAKMSQAQKGRKVSEEAKENMRRARLAYLAENGPYESTPERNEKISKAKKGKKFTSEHCVAMGNARKGKKHSEEHKQKISEGTRKFYKENPEVKEILSNLWTGKNHTEESKQQMRDSWVLRKQKKLEARVMPTDLSLDE